MTKKSLNKLLSVILTLAICFTTVFGCFITASATDGSTAGDCDHVFDVICCTSVQKPVDGDGYYVYKDVPCEKCGAVNEYQVVPETEFKNVIYWDGSTKTEPTKTDAEGNYYLITSAAELAYITSNTVSGNYKIADGIDVIVLQPKETVIAAGGLRELMDLSDYNQTKDYFESGVTFSKWANTGIFQGTFDGNGVEIYGLYANVGSGSAGLFPTVYQGTTIKNLAVKNSYVHGHEHTGALVGTFAVTDEYKSAEKTNSIVSEGVISFDRVVVSGCYLYTNNYRTHPIGILCGGNTANSYIPISITNCLIYKNRGVNKNTDVNNAASSYPAGLFGMMSGGWNGDNASVSVPNGKFENIISLDSVPYISATTNQCTKPQYYKNVYTNVRSEYKANTNYEMTSFYDTKNSDGSSRIVLITDENKGEHTAESIVETFTDANGSTVWKIDQNSDYPTPVEIGKTTTSQPELNLLAANIDYKENGTFSFNFYYEAKEDKYDIDDLKLFVGRADGTGSTVLSGTPVDPTVDANDKIFEDAGINLAETNVYKYTIDNISARELGETLLPTAVVTNGESTAYGKTEAISLSKYAKAVFDDSEATPEDKNVVAALVNYGAAAKDVLNSSGSNTEATDTIYWNNWETIEAEDSIGDLNDTNASGDSWEDPILIENADELFWLCRVSTSDVTKGKYFKIADNIKNIILIPESMVDTEELMAMTDTEKIGEYINSLNEGKGWNWDAVRTGSFNGNFDGNGATIYGMRSNALFGTIDCGVHNENNYYTSGSKSYYYDNVGTVIKNINIKNSYYHNNSSGSIAVGGIVAGTCGIADGEKVAGVISFENCSVTNSYFTGSIYAGSYAYESTGARTSNIGAFIGAATDHDIYRINNCITYGNKISITNTNKDIKDTAGNVISVIDKLAVSGAADDRFQPKSDTDKTANTGNRLYNKVTNSILLDNITPYTLDGRHSSTYSSCFSNVYTDQSITFYSTTNYINVMTKIDTKDSLKGTAAETTCPNLDWDSEWIIDARGGYPSPVQRATSAGKTIYWQGDAGSETSITAVNDTGASGASTDAIIIDNAEELYWVLRQAGVDNTVGNYFKIADGIDRIVLQPKGVLDLDELLACENGTAVKEYFEKLNESTLKSWAAGSNSRAVFDGNIDGNGVEILGLYTKSTAGDDKVGFIGAWDGGKKGDLTIDTNNDGKIDADDVSDPSGITVKNFTVGYSYMISNGSLGVFGAESQDYRSGACVKGVLKLDTCAVINCYLKGTNKWLPYNSGRIGVVAGGYISGKVGDVVKMNNMLVYDNDATDYNGNPLRLKGGVANDLKDENGKFVYNNVTNSLVLGADPFAGGTSKQWRINEKACFTNLYTDTPRPSYDSFTDDNAIQINPAELIGSKAQGIVDKFNGVDGTTWYIGNEYDGIPSLKPATILPTAMQKAYNSLKLTQYDNYGESDLDFGIYTTNINLKNNPYMGITFALNGEYKQNRHKVDITISTVDANDAVLKEIKDADDMRLPQYIPGEEINKNGWTNKQNAGRYHLYTLKDLPVTDMCKSLKITMSYGEGAEAKTVEAVISLEGFGCYKQNQYLATGNEYYAKCAEAAKALVYYSQALNERFSNDN